MPVFDRAGRAIDMAAFYRFSRAMEITFFLVTSGAAFDRVSRAIEITFFL